MKYTTIASLTLAALCASAPAQQTPPMGWNSWNKFHGNISGQLIRETADGMKRHKLHEAGYKYIVIDDCWQETVLDNDMRLVPSAKKFPKGMKALSEYVRTQGFELGLYSSPNAMTCAGFPGSLGLEKLHARQFVDWGVKFMKYDYCPTRNKERELPPEEIIERYKRMHEAVTGLDDTMIFAICEKGWAGMRTISHSKDGKLPPVEIRVNSFRWSKEISTMWRTTNDIKASWPRIMKIVDFQQGLEVLAGPGSFNDPDMLEVGNGKLTQAENRAHFSLWCMLAAPLMLGNDVRDIPDDVLEIITNKEMISINQDKLCVQASRIHDKDGINIYSKKLAGGDVALCVLNRSEGRKSVTLHAKDLGITAPANALNVWTRQQVRLSEKIQVALASHDVVVWRIAGKS